MPMAEQVQPLAGVKVVEFTHMVMGPTAGVILADLGAEVIKVEPLQGDNTRRLKGSGGGYFAMYNRNKSSLCLDLKSTAGMATARRIIDGSDILIENFRPGAMDKLGLGYETLSETNPRLIYCSLKGFLSGPYEHRTALDEVTQMMGGLAYMTGLPDRPMRAGSSVIDITGGMFGVIGILAALQERHSTGAGQYVTSSLFETTAFLVGQHIAQQGVLGEEPPPMSVRRSAWSIYDIFTSAEGERIFVGVVSDSLWQRFFFFSQKVAHSKALYGRIDLELHLQPLSIPEIRRVFHPPRSIREVVELYMTLGGIPRYLEMFDATRSARLNIERLYFTPNGYLVREFERIFASHFGRCSQHRQ